MTPWITAMLVWIAAGARVGRVLVKPATTARVAIVLAVAAVATAATIAVPEIGLALDNALPGGLPSGPLSGALHTAAWIGFATATSVVASAAWPVVSRGNLRRIAAGIYGIGTAAAVVTLAWSTTFGWAVVALGCLLIVVTGLRNLDWTALGRGIALYTAGTALVGLLAAAEIRRALAGEPGRVAGAALPFARLGELAALLIGLGAVWIVMELWLRARLLMRRTQALHSLLIRRFPQVVAHEQSVWSTQLRASDQITQIMDALYLQAGGGARFAAGRPPASVPERAAAVARWARDPRGTDGVDARWIAPPAGVSPRRWVQAIARALEPGRGAHVRQ
ncbi:hypothetical protein [Nocardia harenae]|uniref:hypothetical protein n=1 Tax=Nocardia harenae TaxID=358707 RepID=UPI0008336FD1|nr:hypothetical protein [Nocardia harenae]